MPYKAGFEGPLKARSLEEKKSMRIVRVRTEGATEHDIADSYNKPIIANIGAPVVAT